MKGKGGFIVLIILGILLITGFALIANRTPKAVDQTQDISELDELLNKNISSSYPPTPREVVKLYNRYILELYGEDGYNLEDSDIRGLGGKLRCLYDDELLSENPEDSYYMELATDIVMHQASQKTMLQTSVADTIDVKYITIDKKDGTPSRDGATITASYFAKKGNSDFTRTYQRFLLRKDDKGNWKILGFKQISESEL